LEPVPIADPRDPRIALYRGVRDPELLRDHGVFIAEGRLVVQRLLEQSSLKARSVLVTRAASQQLEAALARTACPVFLAEPALVADLAGFNVHRGCLAIGERPPRRDIDSLVSSAGAAPLVVLERVGNPDNVGGVFRNAAALGAAAVLLSPGCADPLYRKTIRTSMGAALTLPFAAFESWPSGLESLRGGRTIVALTTSPDAAPIEGVAERMEGPVALLLGHEGHGLSAEARRHAHQWARIPMALGADSLNVSSATAIALYVFGAP
jgi:tRNA G18 (ribose-2'-O)-methylase SpoU